MTESGGILRLSNELLKEVADQISTDPDISPSIDRRAYLSVESFRPPPPPSPSRAQDVSNFRLTCRRFAEVATPHHFARLATRFSWKGLQRLETICGNPHLAKHTKKFSYMIPDFYVEGRTDFDGLFDRPHGRQTLDRKIFEQKAQDQQDIVRSGEDLRILKLAMRAFTSLQHVQILRLQDQHDRSLLEFIEEEDDDLTEKVDLRWAPACTQAARTVAEALADAKSRFIRFSGPQISTRAALSLNQKPPEGLKVLAECLTCLELHFEEGSELQQNIEELAPSLRKAFAAVKNMQAVHVGFPSRNPLRVTFESIFGDVLWEKLRAFGVQAWRLEAEEITGFARRHRRTLRGLRLRDVLLLEGGRWKEVLRILREDLDYLEWVSLRRIDYSLHFDELWRDAIEVPDYIGSSDDEFDEEFNAHLDLGDPAEELEHAPHDDDVFETASHSASDSDGHSDEGPVAHELALAPTTEPPQAPELVCTCADDALPISAEELGDDGQSVFYEQRKLWERWVVGRCLLHGQPESP